MTSSAEHPDRMDATEDLRGWLLALGVSFATALLVIAPFFWLGNASGHDIAFHAASWLDAAGQWKEGIVYPRWAEWANYGFGEPRFIFYPPLSWMLGAALVVVMPWKVAPAVFIVLAQTVAGVCSFALARRFLSRSAGIAGAACYAANPYALLIVYMRSDFAELLACALMPVAVLAALELSGIVGTWRRSLIRSIAIFALVFAGVWLSNAPAGVLASYSAALIFIWAAMEQKSLRPMWRGAAGLALGFGLSGFYLLPAAYEQRWVNIAQALSSGLLPSQSFLYTMMEDPEHNLFNWIASSVAILLMAMTGIGAVAVHRIAPREKESDETKKLWRVFLVLSAAATFLMIRASSILWEYLPKLRYVQFPWRWMAILAVPYAFFLAAAIARRRPGRTGAGAGWVWGAAVIIVVGGTAAVLIKQAWWDSEDIPVLQEAIANGQGFEGADEYDPASDDHSNLPQKAPRVEVLPFTDSNGRKPKAEIRIERWTTEEREIAVTSTEPLRAALRLLDYPAWRVEVNGKAVTPQHAEANGQMVLPLSPGTQRITARFVRTPDRNLGTVVSGMGLFSVLVLYWAGRRRLVS